MDAELKASLDRLRESVDALRLAIETLARVDGADTKALDLYGQLQVLSRLEQEGLISEDEYSERKDELLRRWPS